MDLFGTVHFNQRRNNMHLCKYSKLTDLLSVLKWAQSIVSKVPHAVNSRPGLILIILKQERIVDTGPFQ